MNKVFSLIVFYGLSTAASACMMHNQSPHSLSYTSPPATNYYNQRTQVLPMNGNEYYRNDNRIQYRFDNGKTKTGQSFKGAAIGGLGSYALAHLLGADVNTRNAIGLVGAAVGGYTGYQKQHAQENTWFYVNDTTRNEQGSINRSMQSQSTQRSLPTRLGARTTGSLIY